MKAIIAVFAVAVLCIAYALFGWPNSSFSRWADSSVLVSDRGDSFGVPRVLTAVDIQLTDLPDIASAMSQSSAEVRYATIAFCPPDCRSDDDGLNVQISIEDSKLGLDWVLLGPRNVRDQEKFERFAQAEGFEPVMRVMNEVSYLRVDSEEAPDLVNRIVTEMYRLPPNGIFSLYHEGFDWPQS